MGESVTSALKVASHDRNIREAQLASLLVSCPDLISRCVMASYDLKYSTTTRHEMNFVSVHEQRLSFLPPGTKSCISHQLQETNFKRRLTCEKHKGLKLETTTQVTFSCEGDLCLCTLANHRCESDFNFWEYYDSED